MDSGALVFIIIGLGVVVVWQASKLNQYQRFERMMPGDAASAGTRKAPAAPPPAPSDEAAESARSTSPEPAEGHIEEAKRVQLIMARCRYAEFYIEQLDDDYEREQFRTIVTESIDISRGITDPLLEATALEPLVLLLDTAGWEQWRDDLLVRISDDVVRQRIEDRIQAEA